MDDLGWHIYVYEGKHNLLDVMNMILYIVSMV